MKNQITITIQGNAATGKTTIATIIAKALAENGVNHSVIDDESEVAENIELNRWWMLSIVSSQNKNEKTNV